MTAWFGRVLVRVGGFVRLALLALTFGCVMTAIPLLTESASRSIGIAVIAIPPVLIALYLCHRWKKARAADVE